MNRRQTFAFFYGLRRQHKPVLVAAAIAAWHALRPTPF
jgi:hypothetical protein